MKEDHKKMIQILTEFLEKNPDQKFAQALFNLNINQLKNSSPNDSSTSLRDIYNDSDQRILSRMIESGNIFDLTSTKDDGTAD